MRCATVAARSWCAAAPRSRTIRKDREAIVVTELPYQVNKQTLIERIAEMVREKRLEGISDVRDESDRQGMRIVIELKRDASGDVILNQLWRYTAMQSSFGVNMLALNHGRPSRWACVSCWKPSWTSAKRWWSAASSSN